MGVVYRAVDTTLGRTVAIKTISLGAQGTPEEAQQLRARLMREAQAAATLSHPNVVTVYDAGQEGDATFVVMELVQGGTLDSALADPAGPRSPEAILKLLAEVAHALDYAHAHGIVHRDVKPANIFIEETGGVKLGDFGIAKVTWSRTMTETGTLAGSPHYMSPEQLRGERVTGRTDQFALGAVAYRLLTGRKPFDSDTFASLASKILFEDAPSPAALGVQLGAEAEKVLRKAMSKAPTERFENCTEFVEALTEAVLHHAPAPQPPKTTEAHRRGWLVPVTLAAMLIVVAAGLFLWLRQQGANRAEAADWESTRNSKDAAVFDAYLKRYPRGRFAADAQREIQALRTATAAIPALKKATVDTTAPAKPVAAGTEAKGAEVKASKPVLGVLRPLGQRVNSKDGLVYIGVAPGTFHMGCLPDDPCDCCSKPSHPVTITKGFWIGQTAVTIDAYRQFARASGREMPPAPTGWGNCYKDATAKSPMCNVTWDEANAFCQYAGGRLPTEAEWEYAARAGWSSTERSSRGIAPFGQLNEIAWLDLPPHPVGQKAPNALGLYDTLGLMSEWSQDFFSHQYPDGALTDPVSQTDKRDDYPAHVLRGGHTEDMASMPFNSLVSLRQRGATGEGIGTTRAPGYGFRCVLPAP